MQYSNKILKSLLTGSFFFLGFLSGPVFSDDEKIAQLEERIRSLENSRNGIAERIQVNGFLSAGISRTDLSNRELDYFSSPPAFLSESVSYGYGDIHNDWDHKHLSRFGLQISMPVNDKTEATIQLIGRGDDNFSIEAEWAYMAFQTTPNTRFRVGRLRSPIYMLSEYLDVGYSYPFVSPPIEVYGAVPISNFDGIDFSWNTPLADWSSEVRLIWGGRYHEDTIAGEDNVYKLHDITGIDWRLTRDDLTLRAGYSHADISLDHIPTPFTAPMFDLVPPSPEPDTSIEDILNSAGHTLTIERQPAYFSGVGFQWEPGNFLLMAETVELRAHRWIGDFKSRYFTAGYRMGSVLPYLTRASTRTTDRSERTFVELGSAALLLPFLMDQEQRSLSLGVRWDVLENTAFKAELSRIYDYRETAGYFSQQPRAGDVRMVSLAVDIVF